MFAFATRFLCLVILACAPAVPEGEVHRRAMMVTPDDTMDVMFTSGTTGRPKGVRRELPSLQPEVLIGAAGGALGTFGLRPGHGVHLACSPLYHTAPGYFALNALHVGHSLVLHEIFDAENVLRAVEEYRVTSTHMVPTHVHRILGLPAEARDGYDLSSLETILVAGAPFAHQAKRTLIDWLGPIVWEYLGSTEGMVCSVSPPEALEHPGTVGKPADVKILDEAGNEIVRHGASGFLGELNLLSGQTVFLTAVVTKPLRYVAVDRDALRAQLFEDGPLSDLVLSTFIARREALQRVEGVGLEIVGPRSSEATMQMLDFARANRLPFTWHEATPTDGTEPPLVRLPGGAELQHPSRGEVLRALGIGRELAPREEVDLLVVGGGPAGLAAAVYGASEGLDTLIVESTALGGQAGSSRRIENYLGFPAGISGTELTGRAVSQARKFGARPATPYRAISLEPGDGRHLVRLEEEHEIAARAVVLATGAAYRRLPLEGLADYEGLSVFYAVGPPEAQVCGASRVAVVGGGNSAGQAAVWLARGGALVTLLHRRADLGETMSDYLIRDLERYGVAVRDRSEIAALHGTEGLLDEVTLKNGERLPFAFLFFFLGAQPCTEWLDDTVARAADGFILTGNAAGVDNLLETSVPGIFAAGDVRSGSSKRCAAAVGEGSMAVQFVHAHLAALAARVG